MAPRPARPPRQPTVIAALTIAIFLFFINKDTSTERLKAWLRSEAARLGPGGRLPSTRSLVQAHHLSPLTVSRALAELVREGIVVSRPGAGTFVAQTRGSQPGGSAGYSWQTVALGGRVCVSRQCRR